jgi:hypothetical protein
MDQTPHTPPDGLDKLLQKYLLEKNPLGPDGKPLMEAARRSALGAAPVVTPPSGREAEMLRRLETRVAELPKPGPAGISAGMRWVLFSATSVAVVTTASLLLWLQPFRNNESGTPNVVSKLVENNPHSEKLSGTQSAVVPWVDNTPLASEEVKERSLQRSNQEQGHGNLGLNSDRGHSRSGTRSANSTNALQRPDEGQTMADPVSSVAADPPALTPALDLFPLRSVFQQLSPEISLSTPVSNDNGLLMETRRGTLLHIPAGAFVTLSGLPVKGEVEVNVREAYDRSDFLRANLAGLPGENAFVNGGAIEITATYKGQPVMLASGKDIYVVYARNSATEAEQLRNYAGFRNETGRMAWTASGEVASRMVPISAEDMHFGQFACRDDRDVHWSDQLDLINNNDPRNPYLSTWVYTLEFRDRIRAAYDMGHASPVLKMYLENTDKELWTVDQMVAQAIRQNPTKMGNPLRDDRGAYASNVDANTFFRFAEQRKSTLLPYKVPAGINLDAPDARVKLEQGGMSHIDATKLLRTHALRKVYTQRVILAAVVNPKAKNITYREVSTMPDLSSSTAYHVRQLGWNLRSEPLVTPVMKSTSLTVKVNGLVPGSRAWVVMEQGNVIAEGLPTADGFVFSSLPTGVNAQVVVLGGTDAAPASGLATLKTGKALSTTVEMAATSLVKLDRELNQLDQ